MSQIDKSSYLKDSYFAKRIETGFLQFISYEMIITTLLFGALIFLLRDFLYNGFQTNLALNGSIIATFIYSVFLVFYNNIDTFQLARYLKKIEEVELSNNPKPEEIDDLRLMLLTKGRSINIHATFSILSHIKVNGFFCATTDDASVIKNAVQKRASFKRGHISFLSSILVTLGLIGTFWGLILTITAIGETMTSISNMFAEDTGGNNIGALIDGISAPLSGMGVAFSSSLFGLAGSLIVNILSTLATRTQNIFFDKFYRWIDEHTPDVNVELKEKIHSKTDSELPIEVNQNQDDLIKAFVVLSRDTHRYLKALSDHINDLVDANEKQTDLQHRLADEISLMREGYSDLKKDVDNRERSYMRLSASFLKEMKGWHAETLKKSDEHTAHAKTLTEMSATISKSSNHIMEYQSNISQVLESYGKEQKDTTNKLSSNMTEMLNKLESQNALQASMLKSIDSLNDIEARANLPKISDMLNKTNKLLDVQREKEAAIFKEFVAERKDIPEVARALSKAISLVERQEAKDERLFAEFKQEKTYLPELTASLTKTVALMDKQRSAEDRQLKELTKTLGQLTKRINKKIGE